MASALIGWRLLRNEVHGPVADLRWITSGRPFSVLVSVADSNGSPVAGANVHVNNSSGGNEVPTDENGYAQLSMGEPDLQGISINGIRVMGHRFFTSVARGLFIAIVIKDTNSIPLKSKLQPFDAPNRARDRGPQVEP